MRQGRANNDSGKGVVALIATLALILALAFVPAGLAASHGPGAYAASLEAGAGHGHVHTWDDTDATQHDATDHEHQTAAILPASGHAGFDVHAVRLYGAERKSFGRSRDGPRRPPRGRVI
ncbi:MAG: hypothetical protein ACRC14_19330 [Paracoccaceae bacterium]